jgi:hypothetical protein
MLKIIEQLIDHLALDDRLGLFVGKERGSRALSEQRPDQGTIRQIKVLDKRDKSPSHVSACRSRTLLLRAFDRQKVALLTPGAGLIYSLGVPVASPTLVD